MVDVEVEVAGHACHIRSAGSAETKALAVAEAVEHLLAFMAKHCREPSDVVRVYCDLTTRSPGVDPALETVTLGVVLRKTGPSIESGDSADG